MNKSLITNYYSSHRDELLAFVSSRLGGSCEAEDIVQNVFLRLLTTDKMITEVTLHALVYTTARNLIIDYYRRHTVFEEYEHYIKGMCSEETTTESEDAWSNSTTDTLSATQTYTPDEEIVQRSSGGRGRSGRGRSRSSRSSYEPLEVNTSYGKAGDFNSGRTAKTIDVPSRNKLISEAQRSRDPEWYLTNLINKKIISVEDACYILDYMDDTKAFYEDNRDRILENNRQKIEEIREARNAGRGVRAGAAINSYLYGGK